MNIRQLEQQEIPKQLLEIPQPPKKLHIIGELPKDHLYLAVVGSRKHTIYGAQATRELIAGLAGYNIAIISGLAYGIDAIAHEAAIASRLPTIAIPGSGLDEHVLYPRAHVQLAQKIVSSGGCLLSEFEPDFKATNWSFPQRNRIMAGLAQAVLIIEAEEKSGTLITARMATDYNRDVLVVPGSIFSPASTGTNSLLRIGATPIVSSKQLLEALHIEVEEEKQSIDKYQDCSKEELQIIELLFAEPLARDEMIRKLQMPTSDANRLISIMEIKGLIKEELGQFYVT